LSSTSFFLLPIHTLTASPILHLSIKRTLQIAQEQLFSFYANHHFSTCPMQPFPPSHRHLALPRNASPRLQVQRRTQNPT
jgi:hypothetical protein